MRNLQTANSTTAANDMCKKLPQQKSSGEDVSKKANQKTKDHHQAVKYAMMRTG